MLVSRNFDIAGPLAKSPKDVADLLTVLVDPSKTQVPEGGYASALDGDWKDIKVGTLDSEFWNMPSSVIKPVEEATKQLREEARSVYARIESLAKSYHGNISKLGQGNAFDLGDGKDALSAILSFDIEKDMDTYLGDLSSNRVRSLKELVDWNFEHSGEALTLEYPNQDLLVSGIQSDHDEMTRKSIWRHIKAVGVEFTDLFASYDVDVIIAPPDSPLFKFSGAGGFPTATLPISCLDFNGRPFGLTIAVLPHNEPMLFKAMSAWEATFPPRKTPEAFLSLKPID